MSYIVIKSGDDIEIIEEQDFSADKDEKYLHKIVEDNPQIIMKEIIERDVVTLASHLKLPSGGELDLLLVDSTGGLTLVELKKGKGYREAIAQLLDYASDLQQMEEEDLFASDNVKFKSIEEIYEHFYGSSEEERSAEGDEEEFSYEEFKENFLDSLRNNKSIQLVLVSYEVGEDTIRLVEWLRKFGVNIFAVEFQYFRSESKEIFVPKSYGGIQKSEITRSRRLTETKQKYYRFFAEVLPTFKESKPGVTEKRPFYDPWLQIPSGYSDIAFEWRFRGREPEKVLDVALIFQSRDKNRNQKLLEYFQSKEKELQETFKSKVKDVFDLSENRIRDVLKFGKSGRSRRIYVEKEISTLDQALENNEIKDWAVKMMIVFYEIFKESGELDKAVKNVK